MENLRRKSKFD